MHFDVSTLTMAGKALLTRATAGAKIIWGTCGCFTQSTPGVSSTSLFGKVASGTAVSVFQSTDNTAKISCSVDNTASGLSAGSANSFGLWAKIEGDSAETLVLIAYVTTTPATYFPAYSGVSTKVGAIIDISVTVSDGVVQTISLVESGYALAANLQTEIDEREALEDELRNELESLGSRCVTTHTTSSSTEGDAQIIYGVKTFKDKVVHTDDVLPKSGGIDLGSQDAPWSIYASVLRVCDDEYKNQLIISADVMAGNTTVECENELVIETPHLTFDGNEIDIGANGDCSIEVSGNITIRANSISANGPITASSFHGCLPTPTATSTTRAIIPVGGIVLCRVCFNSASSAQSKRTGDTIIITQSDTSYTIARNSNGTWGAGNYLTTGTYTCLSEWVANGSGVSLFLAMRTA